MVSGSFHLKSPEDGDPICSLAMPSMAHGDGQSCAEQMILLDDNMINDDF